jgi:hypothetical protein
MVRNLLIDAGMEFDTIQKIPRRSFELVSAIHTLFRQTAELYHERQMRIPRHMELPDSDCTHPARALATAVTAGLEAIPINLLPDRVIWERCTARGVLRTDIVWYLVDYWMSQNPDDIVTDDESFGLPEDVAEEFNAFIYTIRQCIGWRPFFTKEGHIGLGPAKMQQDDVICIFSGARAPYVMRPVAVGMYIFIGDCYVHGIMDGEATKNALKLETFKVV